MTTEAAMHAYVLLPNALHLLLHSPEFDFEKHLGISREEAVRADNHLSLPKPDEISAYLEELGQPERDILHRALLVCLRALDEYAFEQRMGLPKEAGGEVLEILRTLRVTPKPTHQAGNNNA